MKFDLKGVFFTGSKAVAIDPKSFVDSGWASSSGRPTLFTVADGATLPHAIKRESSDDEIFAAERRRLTTPFGAKSFPAVGAGNTASWPPISRIASVLEGSRRSKNARFSSFHISVSPLSW